VETTGLDLKVLVQDVKVLIQDVKVLVQDVKEFVQDVKVIFLDVKVLVSGVEILVPIWGSNVPRICQIWSGNDARNICISFLIGMAKMAMVNYIENAIYWDSQ
jgi:hypothetical protein